MPASQNSGSQPALEAFLDFWIERFDSLPSLSARKLSALALCRLLLVAHPWVLNQMTDIVTNITSVWFEVEPYQFLSPTRCKLMEIASSNGSKMSTLRCHKSCTFVADEKVPFKTHHVFLH